MKKRTTDLESIKAAVIARMGIEEAEGKDVWDSQRKALARIEGFPVKRIIEVMQYLKEQIIPAIEKKSKGVQTQEYILFSEIVDMMFWALAVDDRRDFLTRKLGSMKLENEILRDRLQLAESELLKYQTAEELLYADFLDIYLKRAKDRMQQLTKSGKK